jgi:ABC-type uncharacterized transport system involved in gliding motility auxiliary subunit
MNSDIGKHRAVLLLVLTVAVIIAAVLVAERFHIRMDLTSDRAYTLSKASRDLYKEIPERIRINYYKSSALADRHPGPRAVEDFLRELANASRGKISVEVSDPTAGKGNGAGAVEALGIQPQRMQVVEKNEQRVALVYSGIVVQYLGRTQVLPFVLGVETLEYDMVKAIRSAIGDRKSVAAILIGDPDKSMENDYRSLSETLQRAGWEAREVKRGDAVPPETSVLVVIGNSALDDYDVYRIDAWLTAGGKALFAVKGVDVQARQQLNAVPLQQEALLKALEGYGVKVRRELVLDRSSLTVPFQEASQFGGVAIRYVRYPFWISTRPENRDARHPLTARLPGLDLFWPSPLDIVPREGVQSAALLKTTPKAWLQTKSFALGPQDEARYAAEYDATAGQYVLVASLAGNFPSAYAGKALPKREGAEALPPQSARERPSTIVVVGSSDFANDLMTMSNSQFNAAFMADAAEWLSSGDELVSIRTRGARDTRLSKVQEPETRSTLILFSYILNLALLPGAVLAFGLVRAAKRRKIARASGSRDTDGRSAGATAEGGKA